MTGIEVALKNGYAKSGLTCTRKWRLNCEKAPRPYRAECYRDRRDGLAIQTNILQFFSSF